MKKIHILNGDSLKNQLKGLVKEEVIVARECLIDGNVQGESLAKLYANRAKFIAEYDGFEIEDYYQKTVPEIEKIVALPPNCELFCWFEDDLFCQTNFWFVVHLLVTYTNVERFYLVRPNKGNEYSFAGMREKELMIAFENSQPIEGKQLALLAQLWPLYQRNEYQQMLMIAAELNEAMPFLISVIEAQQRRTPDQSGLGYPERRLLAIINELNSPEFSAVFRTFSAQEGIYSFGDMQVKRMFDQLNKHIVN